MFANEKLNVDGLRWYKVKLLKLSKILIELLRKQLQNFNTQKK